MQNNFSLATVYEEDVSDSLSTEFTNQGFYSSEMSSPSMDMDGISSESKKIRKKRNAYQKVDDDMRVQLLEAVQKNGETLKSASKRLDINYSTAKSILHTYRKEGRILKKCIFERTTNVCQFPITQMDVSQINGPAKMMTESFTLQPYNFPEGFAPMEICQDSTSCSNETTPSTPVNRLGNNLDFLLIGAQQTLGDQSMVKPQFPNLIFKTGLNIFSDVSSPSSQKTSCGPQIPTLNLMENQPTNNPLEALKNMDNFYLNYSNSPLSGGRANMFKDRSDSSSKGRFTKEFDSFSDMVNALQSQPRMTEEVRRLPKPSGFRPVQSFQIEPKLMMEESMDWNETIENVAFDTFKSFADAQALYRNALKKASLFNNLMQYQRLSPISNY